jgi:hypothetical protein
MQNSDSIETKCRRASGINIWKVIGSAALLAVVAGLIVNLPDIKRYIKISTM